MRDLLGTRIALVSTFEGGRHYFVGAAGLPPRLDRAREIPMIESFCTYVHEGGAQLVVDDVRHETRVAAHPLIGELGIRARTPVGRSPTTRAWSSGCSPCWTTSRGRGRPRS